MIKTENLVIKYSFIYVLLHVVYTAARVFKADTFCFLLGGDFWNVNYIYLRWQKETRIISYSYWKTISELPGWLI